MNKYITIQMVFEEVEKEIMNLERVSQDGFYVSIVSVMYALNRTRSKLLKKATENER